MGQGLLGNLQIPSQPSPDFETRTCTPLPLLAVRGIATWTLATTGWWGGGLKVWLRRGVYPKCLGRHGLDRIIPCLLPQELPFLKTLTVCLAWGKVFPLKNLFNQLFAHEELESLEV